MLRETLESVERARNANLAEVIIVDDGSTDSETCAYFERLSRSDYKVIRQENRGLGPARNTGVKAAQGEFILPLDSDNRVREPYLSSGVKLLLERSDVGVVYGDAEYFEERSGRWHVANFDLRKMVKENYIDACALYRRSVWESINGYDEEMPWMGWEDWDFWMRVAARGWRFVHLDDIAFEYRVRKDSMIQGTNAHGVELRRYIFEKSQNQAIRVIRDMEREVEDKVEDRRRILESRDYLTGHFLVNHARKVRQLLLGK